MAVDGVAGWREKANGVGVYADDERGVMESFTRDEKSSNRPGQPHNKQKNFT